MPPRRHQHRHLLLLSARCTLNQVIAMSQFLVRVLSELETKDLVGLILIPVALFAGTLALSLSQRLRDAAFLLMAGGAVISDRLDSNFFSRQWYRGTTRGIEFSFIDVLAFSI